MLSELLDCHAAALELYASQWTFAPADCVQEAFIELAAARQQKGLKQTGSPVEYPIAWLYQVVRNKALNAARAQRRRQHHELIAARLTERRCADQLTTIDQLPLLEALDRLPSDTREIVVLRIWSQLTWQEIAELTGTSSSSAQRRYVAALNKLRQHLEPSCHKNLT